MTKRTRIGNLQVADVLYDLVMSDIIPGTGIEADAFWAGLERCVDELGPRNRALLEKRDELQQQIDDWHLQRAGQEHDANAYQAFLHSIGYMLSQCDDFTITTSGTDPEITTIAGPQLVVPVMNARFALNATSARWGSLYDSLYGTDVIPDQDETTRGAEFNPVRAEKAIAYAMNFLDSVMPLRAGSRAEVKATGWTMAS